MSKTICAVIAALLSAVTACTESGEARGGDTIEAAAAVVASKNPFADVEPPRAGDEKLHGRIVEVLRAGSYTYAAVQPVEGEARWVVTMRGGLSAGQEVDVKNMGTQRAFRSRRLGRTFDELIFGIVRPVTANHSEG
ncbi:MAG: hypothetical protein HOV80_34515 [Polyangiaceae bacterium]|nr:hypothetical protein [Polyangiaceae bacterium]